MELCTGADQLLSITEVGISGLDTSHLETFTSILDDREGATVRAVWNRVKYVRSRTRRRSVTGTTRFSTTSHTN